MRRARAEAMRAPIGQYWPVSMTGGQARAAAAPVRLNWRLYRLYLIPVAVALVVAAFAFGSEAPPLRSTLAPEGFSGQRALALLSQMQTLAPSRRPGSAGERRLSAFVERRLQALGAPEDGGYRITRRSLTGDTSFGSRRLSIVVARRSGSVAAAPIMLVAHLDAGSSHPAEAQLSGPAALLELASVLSGSETRHPLEIVFSDGGSAGAGGTAALVESMGAAPDFAIALGDLGGDSLSRPVVQPFSNALGSAPEELGRTVAASLRRELGVDPGKPGFVSQLMRLAFPLAVGEQGVLDAAGVPAVGVDLAGERGAAAREGVSRTRMEESGRALLSAFYALDSAAEVDRGGEEALPLAGRTLPGWALRLLIGAMLLAPLAVSVDAFVRLSRRGRQAGRWISLSLSCALPFLAAAVALKLIAQTGLLPAPPAPVPTEGLGFGAGATISLLLALAVLGGGLALWWSRAGRPLIGRVGNGGSGGIGALAAASALGVLVWIVNPYAALFIVPALHLWPLVVCPARRPREVRARLALALAPLIPLGLLLLYYAVALDLGPGQMLLSGLMLLGGGEVGLGAAVVWSLLAGLFATMLLAAFAQSPRDDRRLGGLPIAAQTPVGDLGRLLARAADRA